MFTNEKKHPLFRGKTGFVIKGSRSFRYEVYVYNEAKPASVHLFQDNSLWKARGQAIDLYHTLIHQKKENLIELNFAAVFENDEVSVMELVSNAVHNFYAKQIYGQLAESEYTNHWMNTAALELDMYLLFKYNFEGYLENLKYGYTYPETGQLYGNINALPGTGALYNYPGLITEVTFNSHSLPEPQQVMNKKY